jgi:hypothetical protein
VVPQPLAQQALESLRLQRNEEELNELFGRIDINDDGEIDFDEFQFMVQNNTQLEMLMRSLPVHRVLANQFGGSIERYSQMSDSEMDDIVLKTVPLSSGILKQHARSLREAEAGAAQAAVAEQRPTAAGKFAFTLQGGDLDDYHGGVTERVGEPHADPAEGMEEERTSSGDADVLLSSSNYGVTTCPRREWMIVTTGGGGLSEEDTRVLRPLEYYDGLERVKDAGLTRPEIIAIILYTGSIFQIYNGMLRRFGHCGVVDGGTQPVPIMERCAQHDNFYPCTVHCLVSGIKKLQQAAGPEYNRGWLYRGLSGGQLPASFRKRGFAEWAFMSTTKDLRVAVDYSGAKQGKAATLLKIEMSDVDAAVGIKELSQYPREEGVVVGRVDLPPARRGEGRGAHHAPRTVPGHQSQAQFKRACAHGGGACGAAEEATPGGGVAKEAIRQGGAVCMRQRAGECRDQGRCARRV